MNNFGIGKAAYVQFSVRALKRYELVWSHGLNGVALLYARRESHIEFLDAALLFQSCAIFHSS